MPTVVFVQGGGIGLDQEAVRCAASSTRSGPASRSRFTSGRSRRARTGEGGAAARNLRRRSAPTDVALKTKLLQPKGPGTPTAHGPKVPPNFNVAFRRGLGLFASVRPVHNLPGLPSRFTGVDYLLVREITEDLYTASEHEIVPGVVQSFKIVTEAACVTASSGSPSSWPARTAARAVHCIHKANILKMADGLYLDCFRKRRRRVPGHRRERL